MIVYLLTNKINGKRYVGLTKRTLEERWAQHVSNAKSNVRTSRQLIVRAIKKYGDNNFTTEIIETCEDKKTMCLREIYWIDALKTRADMDGHHGYNLTDGGEGINGYIPTKESIERYRISHLKCNLSQSTLEKMRVSARKRYFEGHGEWMRSQRKRGEQHFFYRKSWRKDFTVSDATRKKISDSRKGMKLSEEHKRSISKSLKGRPGVNLGKKWSDEIKFKHAMSSYWFKKPVAEYDIDGNCVCVNLSRDNAAENHLGTKLTPSRIHRSIKNNVHIYGLLFIKSEFNIRQLKDCCLMFGEDRKV